MFSRAECTGRLVGLAGLSRTHATELKVHLFTKAPPLHDLGVLTDLGIVVGLHVSRLLYSFN